MERVRYTRLPALKVSDGRAAGTVGRKYAGKVGRYTSSSDSETICEPDGTMAHSPAFTQYTNHESSHRTVSPYPLFGRFFRKFLPERSTGYSAPPSSPAQMMRLNAS